MTAWYRLFGRGALRLAILLTVALAPSASRPAAAGYLQTNLVSDIPGLAAHTDANLVNPWGITVRGMSPIWVSDNGTGVSTIYDGHGNAAPLVVTIPPPAGSPPGTTAAPTGVVGNTSMTSFIVKKGASSGPSFFIFVTEDGTISGWNPAVDMTHAILAVDNSASEAVYKGVTLLPGATPSNDRLYVANFRAGTVEVYNSSFGLVASVIDPTLPPGYAPFNIANLGGKLYVAFAKQDEEREDDVPGPGHGFVDTLDPASLKFTRLISGHPGRAPLNSPWGLALAPAGFGEFSHALLVGNFGNGGINAFDPATGAFLGRLRYANGRFVRIDGLWGLLFGNGTPDRPTTTLFFTAGIDNENHGLFGTLTVP